MKWSGAAGNDFTRVESHGCPWPRSAAEGPGDGMGDLSLSLRLAVQANFACRIGGADGSWRCPGADPPTDTCPWAVVLPPVTSRGR
ncbi:hypothetical protein ACE1SV_65530 [Streptomyces sennicomposti]